MKTTAPKPLFNKVAHLQPAFSLKRVFLRTYKIMWYTFLIEHFQMIVFKMSIDALEKCFLP